MATFATIRAKILALLTAVTSLSCVYDYHRSDLQGYPAATFDVSDSTSDFSTNRENSRVITFKIWIYQETSIKTYDQGNDILDAVADAVIVAIENDYSLTGTVDFCEPTAGGREQIQSPEGLIIRQELLLKCHYTSTLTF